MRYMLLSQPAKEVAPLILGSFLLKDGKKAKVIETEAYCGEKDLACHASKGRTKRTEVMYGAPGTIYVYLCYGMHHMLNIVVAGEGEPEAILVRGVEIDGERISGPGRVTKALGIDMGLNGKALGEKLDLEISEDESQYTSGPRIGVDYAGAWAKKKLRFLLK